MENRVATMLTYPSSVMGMSNCIIRCHVAKDTFLINVGLNYQVLLKEGVILTLWATVWGHSFPHPRGGSMLRIRAITSLWWSSALWAHRGRGRERVPHRLLCQPWTPTYSLCRVWTKAWERHANDVSPRWTCPSHSSQNCRWWLQQRDWESEKDEGTLWNQSLSSTTVGLVWQDRLTSIVLINKNTGKKT